MAGYISNGIAIDYHDGEGSVVIGKKKYRWEFHHYCGPFFINKNGEPSKIQPGENHPVWPHFNKWLKKYNKARTKARAHEIVKV